MKTKRFITSIMVVVMMILSVAATVFAQDRPIAVILENDMSDFLVVDGATISNNGVSWIHPNTHPYARTYITNTSDETMTVTFTHGDGSLATFTISANSSRRFIGTNYHGTIRISFSTSSGAGTGTVSVRASNVSLS